VLARIDLEGELGRAPINLRMAWILSNGEGDEGTGAEAGLTVNQPRTKVDFVHTHIRRGSSGTWQADRDAPRFLPRLLVSWKRSGRGEGPGSACTVMRVRAGGSEGFE